MKDERFTRLLVSALEERAKWDEAPELYLIIDCHGELELISFGVNDTFWQMMDPPEVLQRLAYGFLHYDELPEGKPEAPLPPPGFAGVAFRFEAWSVCITETGTKDAERLRRAVAEHDLHLQPERVEVRQILACGIDGGIYWVTQDRGGQVHEEEYGTDPAGRVPQALAEMVMGLKSMVHGC